MTAEVADLFEEALQDAPKRRSRKFRDDRNDHVAIALAAGVQPDRSHGQICDAVRATREERDRLRDALDSAVSALEKRARDGVEPGYEAGLAYALRTLRGDRDR